ncbi:MAG: hypothetical protein ACD_80C00174G0031 [uncultured bacterium (gcode 4)]|uniref:Uncharacterized protein n=1 Tax=uncultured bacterium (gcode 4) TaxID=1234023 RepID=K1XHH3_9BACT|nr:MAG: hypothetical protein ACD_80C00174G0031 [uncultured bacterium (gcode 4)]
MWVNKIIYVTPAESYLGELTSSATSQLRKVVNTVLEWTNKELIKVFRTTQKSQSQDSLLYLSNKCVKTGDINEALYYSESIWDPKNISEVMYSTRKWEVVVVGVTQKELVDILEYFKNNWYNVVDTDKINHRTNIYAVSIDPSNKQKSSFFEAVYGQ